VSLGLIITFDHEKMRDYDTMGSKQYHYTGTGINIVTGIN